MATQTIMPKEFYIVGYPVLKSKSPLLHNTAFKHHNLPHRYSICNTQDLNDLLKLMQAPSFGGASITMPHKLEILDHVDELSVSARALGAVNTLIPTTNSEGKLIIQGENTDWLGIMNLLEKQLGRKDLTVGSDDVGLVLGAGGAARSAVYALHKLGFQRIYLRNRSRARAQALKNYFPSQYNIQIIDGLTEQDFEHRAPLAIVGTIPSEGIVRRAEIGSGAQADDKVILETFITSRSSGVAVEMAYSSAETALTALVRALPGWEVDTGIMVLLQQGYAQFRMWTGLNAPQDLVENVVLTAYNDENVHL